LGQLLRWVNYSDVGELLSSTLQISNPSIEGLKKIMFLKVGEKVKKSIWRMEKVEKKRK
jgi:hypothetical protein